MKTTIFDYPFNSDLIATSPVSPRHKARMLCVGNGNYTHKSVLNLPEFLNEKDCILLNNTKVIKARLNGQIISEGRSAKFEITLHKLQEIHKEYVIYTSFVKGAKKLRVDDTVLFSGECSAEITFKDPDTNEVWIKFHKNMDDLSVFLDEFGKMPLPPYIASKRSENKEDEDDYQTIFAKYNGSVAAPTASLHFDEVLLNKIKDKNIDIQYVTLHVGGGTFLPVTSDDIKDHKMHSEYAHLSEETTKYLNKVKQRGGRILCIGTTSLRVLESAANNDGVIEPFNGNTDIFISPPYKFKAADMLLTNFHLPKSTLFMLVCAFSGIDIMKKAYKLAQEEKYRFFSYGDACLLL